MQFLRSIPTPTLGILERISEIGLMRVFCDDIAARDSVLVAVNQHELEDVSIALSKGIK